MAFLNQPLDFGAAPDLGPQVAMPAPKKRGGMFGAGKPDWVGAISAALNGYLASRGNPVGMMGLQAIQQQRQQALAEQQHQQRRGEQFEDWVKQQAWKRSNPDPANPHYFESNSGDVYSVLPGQQPQLQFRDPFRYKLVPNGLGGVTPVSIEALMAGQGQAAPPGVTFTPIDEGGPAPSGPGGFPRSY